VAVSDDSQDHQGSTPERATAHPNTIRPEQKARIPLHKQDKPQLNHPPTHGNFVLFHFILLVIMSYYFN